MMELSIVSTLYCSAPYLESFYQRVRNSAASLQQSFEIVLVNDGSPDASLEIALRLQLQDARIRIIDLSRNFGHHQAMMTGLMHARGEMVFLIDSDLEEDPELLEIFYQKFRATRADVVYGVQERRKGGLFERLSGAIFFKAFNALSSHPLPRNLVTARLMTRKYVDALVRHQERETLIAGLWVLTGFDQVSLTVTKSSKRRSSYSLRKRIAHFVNAITSFTSKPLVFIFYLGCFILLLSTIAAIDLILRKLLFGTLLAGWASLMVSIWLLGGLTIFCLGVIGIYLSKVFIEVKQRPYTVIKQIYEVPGSGTDRQREEFQTDRQVFR